MTELVTVRGLSELREALVKTIPLHMQGAVMQKALAAGAKPVVEAAKNNAPVLTGRLKRAIYSIRNGRACTSTYESRAITVRSGKKFQKSNRDAYYWRWVEFGRGAISSAKSLGTTAKGFFGKQIRAVPAHPFMRPALPQAKSAATEAIRAALSVQIVIAAGKIKPVFAAGRKAGASFLRSF